MARFWFSGPRILGIRPGISFSPNDFRRRLKPAARKIEDSFVYVIKAPNDRVKIGVTKNPSARLASLQTGSHMRLRYSFIACTPGQGYDIEAAAHNILHAHRLEGEWFDVPDEMAVAAVTTSAWKLGRPLAVVSQEQADQALAIAASEDRAISGTSFSFADVIGGSIKFALSIFLLALICTLVIMIIITQMSFSP